MVGFRNSRIIYIVVLAPAVKLRIGFRVSTNATSEAAWQTEDSDPASRGGGIPKNHTLQHQRRPWRSGRVNRSGPAAAGARCYSGRIDRANLGSFEFSWADRYIRYPICSPWVCLYTGFVNQKAHCGTLACGGRVWNTIRDLKHNTRRPTFVGNVFLP